MGFSGRPDFVTEKGKNAKHDFWKYPFEQDAYKHAHGLNHLSLRLSAGREQVQGKFRLSDIQTKLINETPLLGSVVASWHNWTEFQGEQQLSESDHARSYNLVCGRCWEVLDFTLPAGPGLSGLICANSQSEMYNSDGMFSWRRTALYPEGTSRFAVGSHNRQLHSDPLPAGHICKEYDFTRGLGETDQARLKKPHQDEVHSWLAQSFETRVSTIKMPPVTQTLIVTTTLTALASHTSAPLIN